MYFILLFIFLYILNSYLTFKQVKRYKQTFSLIKKNYPASLISTGKVRKFFSSGKITILAINKNTNKIDYATQMSGVTVFANFKELTYLKNLDIYYTLKKYNKDESIIQAINFYIEHIS